MEFFGRTEEVKKLEKVMAALFEKMIEEEILQVKKTVENLYQEVQRILYSNRI